MNDDKGMPALPKNYRTVLMRPSPKGSEPYVKYKIPRTEARLKIKELRKQLKKRNRSNGK